MSSTNVNADISPSPWAISTRLTVLYIGSATLILLLIGFYLYQSLANTLAQDNKQFLLQEIQLLRSVLQEQPPNLERLADEQSEGVDLPTGGYYSRILDKSGHSLSETPGMDALPVASQFPVLSGKLETKETIQTIVDGRSFMLMTASSKTSSQHTIQIGLDISHEAALLSKYRTNLGWAIFVGLFFSSIAAVLVARRGLNPLTEMTRHIEGITATQLHAQLDPARYPKELFALAFAFNAMLSRLSNSFNQLTQFSADLAHELRTPINNLMGESEVALSRPRSADEYQQILESNLEEYGRLSQIIETLLFLARAENTEIALHKTRLDGRAELEAACSYLEALAEEHGVRLSCQGQGFLLADAQLLKRVLSNLLLNAIQHTPAGGEICSSIQTTDDGTAFITVKDSGCGISAEHLPKLFDRFYRVTSARSEVGTGLGLAIIKSIMDLHGGKVIISSVVGQGTLVTLRFAVANPMIDCERLEIG
ncbi:heavy metal sensor histidine kinase [Methylomonas sp. UP202]|uniref:heavy metal sensor histidine kinase n=1 Tax=Methylomonas sp. UP202 TaxID=3040943 RepID=UPI00247AB811|nr:heavy metal sensor histidine kinase [Methylomonas sp. UP202]WGS85052.1 heavy metal sensor histidine kinase [Methylomonas sp. UP202]